VFRELAVSYLGRNDLAHVDVTAIGNTVMGGGVDEGAVEADALISRGMSRGGFTKKVMVLADHGTPAIGRLAAGQGGTSRLSEVVTAYSTQETTIVEDAHFEAANDHDGHGQGHGHGAHVVRSEASLRFEARVKGYEGEACGNCGNFTLVRNGTCLKCDTCGSTSGCS
jgi:ribonucleoside-diphosphate reductase alpha chain